MKVLEGFLLIFDLTVDIIQLINILKLALNKYLHKCKTIDNSKTG